MEPGDTRTRILEAAMEVFLEKGYQAATVRDICARAEANVAAVNYHFGSKDALHAAVLEAIMSASHERHPTDEGLDELPTPELRLTRFIRNLMRLSFSGDPELDRKSRLFWLEFGNPSPALTPLVERFMLPIRDELEGLIRALIGPAPDETVRDCAASIAGQTLFHGQNRAVIPLLYPQMAYEPEDMDRLAAHIAAFTLAGLARVRENLERSRQERGHP